NAKTGVGVTITFLYDEDVVKAKTGDDLNIEAGSVSQKAVASTNVESYNAAASVTTTSQGSASIGGGIDVILLKNTADAALGMNTNIDAGGKLDIAADSDVNLLLIAASASVAKQAVAAGGTISFAKNDSKANVTVGANHSLTADEDVTVSAKAVEDVISIIASASAAISGKTAAAGSVNVLVDNAVGKVSLAAGGVGIASRSGSVSLTGEAETRAVNATVAAAGSKDKAVGLSANVSVLQRESGVDVKGGKNYRIDAAKDVLISGYGKDYSLAVSMAVAASTSGQSVSGNLPVLVSRNKVETTLGSVTVNAGGEAAFAARLDDTTKAIAGSLGLSLSNNAAAATAMFVNKANTVTTDMGASSVTAAGSAGTLYKKLSGEADAFKGIYVGAKVADDVLAIAAGIALSGNKGITGNALWSGNDNTVKADASRASLSALQNNANGQAVGGGSVAVKAVNESGQLVLAGGLNGAKSIAAGATVAVLTSAKTVKALSGTVKAWRDVNVSADNTDTINEIAVSAGGSGKTAVEIGIAFQALKSKVNAITNGNIAAVKGDFNLTSKNNANMTNVAVALAGAGKAAVTPVFAMTMFSGESNAMLMGGNVKVGGSVKLSAESDKDMDQYTVGAAAAGKAAVSGAVSVTTLKDTTNALVMNGARITAGALDVLAQNDYEQVGASAAIAGAGNVGVAVNGMLTIAKGNALAEMDGAATMTGKANVKATSERDIVNVAATLAVGGQAGVGVTVMGLVAGDKMDQDAADMLTYGNSSDKSNKTFDANDLLAYMKGAGVKDTSDLNLSDDLSGNGNRNADMNVGSEFDASSGYVDDGVYDGDQTGGEDKQMTETADVKKAKNLANTAYSADPMDSVVARIGANGNVTAKGVDVIAEQDTKADVFGATVSGGGTAGVGASLAIAMLRSNVFASATGKIDAKAGAVNVTATSKSGGVIAEQGSDEAKRNEAISNDLGSSDDDDLSEIIDDLKATLNKRSIR
ncbi:MAG: beta strand repeat-containing protein, partial [bacterium]